MPPFEEQSIEQLSKFVYGRAFSGNRLPAEEREAFRQSLVVSATEAWTARHNGAPFDQYSSAEARAGAVR